MKTFKSILAFQKEFDTDEKCRKHLELTRWGGTPACPYCGSVNVHRFPNGKKFNCREKECHRNFTVTVGTIYENSKLPLTKWYLATYILINHSKGISSLQLAGWLDCTQRTAWFLNHRIREMLKENASESLGNEVEADETYVGGKESNRHRSAYARRKELNEKREIEAQGGKLIGHTGTHDKTAVIGMVERNGRVVTKVVDKVKNSELKLFIRWNVVKGAKVYTDTHAGYKGLSEYYEHESVNHNMGEYRRGNAHTNTIEGYWAILKRQITGIHHSVSPQHLQRYCDESAYRYNHRGLTQDEKFNEAIKRSDNRRLKYDDLINTTLI
jgi:transposase-like protein